MLKFPRKEEGKQEKETEGRAKEGKERKERKVKGQNGLVYWERRRMCVNRNIEMRVLGLLPGRQIFLGPGDDMT